MSYGEGVRWADSGCRVVSGPLGCLPGSAGCRGPTPPPENRHRTIRVILNTHVEKVKLKKCRLKTCTNYIFG